MYATFQFYIPTSSLNPPNLFCHEISQSTSKQKLRYFTNVVLLSLLSKNKVSLTFFLWTHLEIYNTPLFIYLFTKFSLLSWTCGSQMCSLPSNTSMTWEIVRNSDSWETTQTCWIRNSGVRSNNMCLIYTIVFESHWFRISQFITFLSVPYWQDFFPLHKCSLWSHLNVKTRKKKNSLRNRKQIGVLQRWRRWDVRKRVNMVKAYKLPVIKRVR